MKSAAAVSTLAIWLTCFCSATAAAATVSSTSSTDYTIEPPARPLAVTIEQADALAELAEVPQYAVPPDTRAAYSRDAQKVASEAGAVGFYVGYFGVVIGILVAAAPL